jgi:glutathione S-transferase
MTDVDVKYLRDRGIPLLMEAIAQELLAKKPSDPEAYLRLKYGGDAVTGLKGESIRLYGTLLCPFTAVAMMAAHYAAVDLNYVEIDRSSVEKGTAPEFLRLSPYGSVPVVEHKATIVYAFPTAVRYLLQGTEAQLASASPRVEDAFDTVRMHVLQPADQSAHAHIHHPRKHRRPQDAAECTRLNDAVRNNLKPIAELYFRESVWMLGTAPTSADMALAAAAFTMKHVVGFDVFLTSPPPVRHWWENVQKMPWFTAALQNFSAEAARLNKHQ